MSWEPFCVTQKLTHGDGPVAGNSAMPMPRIGTAVRRPAKNTIGSKQYEGDAKS